MNYQNRPYRSGGNYSNYRRKKNGSRKVFKVILITLAILALVPLLTLGIGNVIGNTGLNYKTDLLEISEEAVAGNCDADLNYAEQLSLDKKIFTVKMSRGAASSNAYISKAASGSELRLYAGENGNGNSITVESKKNIVYIDIKFSSSSGAYTIGGKEFTSEDTRHIINSTSFTIKNIDDTGSDKVMIKSIYIVYED